MIPRTLIAVFTLVIPLTIGGPACADTFYVCVETTAGLCSEFQAMADGIATFESLGLTGEALGYALAWGLGLVLINFALGMGFGMAVGGLQKSFGVHSDD